MTHLHGCAQAENVTPRPLDSEFHYDNIHGMVYPAGDEVNMRRVMYRS
jgi:hypothetical protein